MIHGEKSQRFLTDEINEMGVSKNRGIPKWMVYFGKSLLKLKWMIWGGKHPYFWVFPPKWLMYKNPWIWLMVAESSYRLDRTLHPG